MIVRCSNCHTPFSLDDRDVGPDGGGIRCSVCGYVFRVEAERTLAWQLRTIDGQSFAAPDLATVRRWIGEGRLHPDDEVSRTGKDWIRLGEMPEFAAAFAGFVDLPPLWRPLEDTLPPLETLGSPDEAEGGEVIDFIPRDPSSGASLDLRSLAGELHAAAVANAGEGEPSEISDVGSLDVNQIDLRPHAVREDDVSLEREAEAPLETLDLRDTGIPDEDLPVEFPEAFHRGDPEDEIELERRSADDGHEASLLDVVAHRLDITTSRSIVTGPHASGDDHHEDLELRPRSRRGPLVAGLAIAFGLTIVAVVPTLRDRVGAMAKQVAGLSAAQERETARPPELVLAADAIAAADGLDQVDDALTRRLQDPALSPAHAAELRLAKVDVLTTRGLRTLVVAAMAGEVPDAARHRSDDDAERAGQLFASTAVDRLDADRVADTRVRLRLLQGRPLVDVRGELGPRASPELAALVEVASLWQPHGDASGPDPVELVQRLRELPARSTLLELGLVLAQHRAGDDEGARATLLAVLARAPEHPSAIAMQAVLGGAPAVAAVGGLPRAGAQAVLEDAGDGTEKGRGAAVPETDETRGLSTDTLIDRGCDAVDAGKGKEALPFLLKAFDRRPHDVDVLTCLGQAHARVGSQAAALRYFDKALARAPRLLPALLGAARASRQAGQPDRAAALYRRVLAVDPGDSEAREFTEAHRERPEDDATED